MKTINLNGEIYGRIGDLSKVADEIDRAVNSFRGLIKLETCPTTAPVKGAKRGRKPKTTEPRVTVPNGVGPFSEVKQ